MFCFVAFLPPLQNIPLIAAVKKANRFLFLYPQIPPQNFFVALKNDYTSDVL